MRALWEAHPPWSLFGAVQAALGGKYAQPRRALGSQVLQSFGNQLPCSERGLTSVRDARRPGHTHREEEQHRRQLVRAVSSALRQPQLAAEALVQGVEAHAVTKSVTFLGEVTLVERELSHITLGYCTLYCPSNEQVTLSSALSFHPPLADAKWSRLTLEGQCARSPLAEAAMAVAVSQSLPMRHALNGAQ